MDNITKIQAGKHQLNIEEVGRSHRKRYVIRLNSGMALSLGATKENKVKIIAEVTEGKFDDYIERFDTSRT